MGVLDWLTERSVRAVESVGAVLPHRCAVPWRPYVFAPVFSGYRDFAPTRPAVARGWGGVSGELFDVGSPVPLRVWFPSIGGTPQLNEILAPCGLYPLVVFAHGQNRVHDADAQATHYLDWGETRIVRQLARAGYVVVVPQLQGDPPNAEGDRDAIRKVIDWMRTGWIHANLLAPLQKSAIIGHSRGAVHAAHIAVELGMGAYCSIGGDFDDWFSIDSSDLATVFSSMTQPKLFIWGTGEGRLDLSWDPPAQGARRSPGTWDLIPQPKHQAVFAGGMHYDYLPAGWAHDDGNRGPCNVTPDVTADVITILLGRYVKPPSAPPRTFPRSLRVTQSWREGLSAKQAFYSGAYLTWLPALSTEGDIDATCQLTLAWDVPAAAGTLTLVAP